MGSPPCLRPQPIPIYREGERGDAAPAAERMFVPPFCCGYPQLNASNFQDLATEIQIHNLYLTLITLLFSYMYDSRTSQHDPTSESAWTICNLTPSFTALDPPLSSHYTGGCHVFSKDELHETLLPSYRRSLAFPLYRSFLLSEKCREDIASILRKGKRTVVRCLLEMKYILDHHEVYYIYSKFWLDDFCVWIQADAR